MIIFVIGGLVELSCTDRMPMQAFAHRRQDLSRINAEAIGKPRDNHLFPRMSQVPCLHEHLAQAARVKYPAACCGVFDLTFA